MSKGAYAGIGSRARKIKKIYAGVGNTARKIKKVYSGINNTARSCGAGAGEMGTVAADCEIYLSRERVNLVTAANSKVVSFLGGSYVSSYSNAYKYYDEPYVEMFNENLVTLSKSGYIYRKSGCIPFGTKDYAFFVGGVTDSDDRQNRARNIVYVTTSGTLGTNMITEEFTTDMSGSTIGNYYLFGGGCRYNGYSSYPNKYIYTYNSLLTRGTDITPISERNDVRVGYNSNYALFLGGFYKGNSWNTYYNQYDAFNSNLVNSPYNGESYTSGSSGTHEMLWNYGMACISLKDYIALPSRSYEYSVAYNTSLVRSYISALGSGFTSNSYAPLCKGNVSSDLDTGYILSYYYRNIGTKNNPNYIGSTHLATYNNNLVKKERSISSDEFGDYNATSTVFSDFILLAGLRYSKNITPPTKNCPYTTEYGNAVKVLYK